MLALLGGLFGFRSAQASAASFPLINTNSSSPQSNLSFPTVVTTSPQHGDVLSAGVSAVSVQFSTTMLADSTAFAVNKTSNYLLVEDGVDGRFQTMSCAGNLSGDDNQVSVNSVTYNLGTFTSTLTINNGTPLSQGSYQFLVCGSTRINDIAGNKLNAGIDSSARFLVIKDVGFDGYVNYNGSGGDGEGVGIGDFNSDGMNDVAMSLSTQVLVYLNNGNAGFNSPVAYTDNVSAEPLAIGDLNNDGRDDIVTADSYSDTIGVFLQQTDGTLASRVIYVASTDPDAIDVGDVSGDGLDDVVVSHWNAGFIGVFVQNTNGTLNPIVKYNSPQAGWDDIAIGDVNNDGRNDVVKSNGQGSTSQALSVYLQNSDGTLAGALSYSLNCSCTRRGIAIGDVTGDGLSDVVITYGGNSPASKIAVYTQGVNGLSSTPVSYNAYDIPEPVELADVDLDGNLDVLTLHGGWDRLGVFLQKGGILSPYDLYPVPYASHYEPQGLAVGDLNEDGAVDVAIADYNYGLTVLYHHTMPVPQVLMGGNTSPLDGEELDTGINQLTVQFNRQMKSDGSVSAANNSANFLLIEDGVDNTFQTTSCASATTGDDTQVSMDSVDYDSSNYFSTLSINNGVPIGVGAYRLLVCGSTSIQDLSGVKLNEGLSDTTITFTVWHTIYKISGNAGTAGAILNYTDGSSKVAIADGSGDYFFKVSEGWIGMVTASKAGFTFTPDNRVYSSVSSDIAGEDYVADPITFVISGNAGMSGATLSFYDGTAKTTTADDSGNYSLIVSYNWNGMITPSKPGYVFTPSSRSYTNVLSNISGENYTAILHYTISGNVGVPGATLSYVNNGPKTVTSSANGSYSFIVPVGWS
ncbi:MAG: VCBS repeat-containing protein, partial [Anaerolineales bacterium]